MRTAFIDYSGSGSAALPSGLQTVVDYWARYHVAKAVIAALALLVLCSACRRLWSSYRRSHHRRVLGFDTPSPVVYALTGAAASLGAIVAAALLMANIQGAVAPLSSAVSLLPAQRDSTLSAAVDVVRDGTASPGRSPVADHLVADFARYHLVVAVLSAVFVMSLLLLALRMWRRRADNAGALRHSTTVASLGALVLAADVAVLCAANVSSAVAPASALAAFFAGG